MKPDSDKNLSLSIRGGCLSAWVALSLFLALSPFAMAARFSVAQSALDAGGGTASSARYTLESSLNSFPSAGLLVLFNGPPFPEKDYIALPATGPLTISVSNLLTNDIDLEGDGPRLSLLRTNTAYGGTVALVNGFITYTPPANPNVRGDSFDYIVTDSFGASSVGAAVLFSSSAAPRLVGFQRTNTTNLVLRFQALPNTSYMAQFRSSFSSDEYWVDYPDASLPVTQRAAADGTFQFVLPVGLATGFFRAVDLESLQNELALERAGERLSMTLRGIPNTIYKLQFRSTLQPADPWRDYPSTVGAFTIRAARDGLYSFSAPIAPANGFFRTIPLDQ